MTGAGGDVPPSFGSPDGYLDNEEGQALIRRIGALSGSRVLVAVAGAPGSGKSTLAQALVARLPGAVLVPMDGFHLDDRLLTARGLLSRKGAAETFDADGFAALHGRLADAAGEVIYPVFDRSREIAIAGAGCVAQDTRIVVIEGNYLLLDRAPWSGLRYDVTLWLDVAEAELQRRLTARWQGAGMDAASVEAHLRNDLDNAAMVCRSSRGADIVIAP